MGRYVDGREGVLDEVGGKTAPWYIIEAALNELKLGKGG